MATEELCGDVTGEPWAFEVECCLRKDHLGDHYAVVNWPQREPQPPSDPALNRWLPQIWSEMLLNALRAGLAKRVEPRERVVNRDEPTFHHEPHPELSGVVVPVLDQAVRMDSATGAVEWGD